MPGMSTLPGATTWFCRHGIDVDYCGICRPPSPVPLAAGHCGKCGAPYTAVFGGAFEPLKFNPTCKCWNL